MQVNLKVKVTKGISSLAVTLKGGLQVSLKKSTLRECVYIFKKRTWTNIKNKGRKNILRRISKMYDVNVKVIVTTFELSGRKE